VGLLIYARSIVLGSTKPSQATWSIWTLNAFLLLGSYYLSGARDTAWLSVGYAIGLCVISILSLKYGVTGWGTLDKVCLAGALLAAGLWIWTGSALLAFILTLIIDMLGIIPTIWKTWFEPGEEDLTSWTILLIGGISSIFAIEKWEFVVASYPLQITVTTLIIVLFILIRKPSVYDAKPLNS
jgi:hypothetical protein